MELNELTELLSDPKKLVEKVKALAPTIPDYAFQIEPEDHRVVKDLTYRPWRDVEVATGIYDEKGNINTVRKSAVFIVSLQLHKSKSLIGMFRWLYQDLQHGGIETLLFNIKY